MTTQPINQPNNHLTNQPVNHLTNQLTSLLSNGKPTTINLSPNMAWYVKFLCEEKKEEGKEE